MRPALWSARSRTCPTARTARTSWTGPPGRSQPVRELHSFAAGLPKDWAAVTGGSPCPTAPNLSKAMSTVKTIKRQIYGRADSDLLAVQPLSRKVSQIPGSACLRPYEETAQSQRVTGVEAIRHEPAVVAVGV
jgi:hypothetical protein